MNILFNAVGTLIYMRIWSAKLTAIQSLGTTVRSEIQEGISEDVKLYEALQDIWRASNVSGR